ncbi:hypothetical protein L1887_61837 [Cichorium endivia]|nr:hypothetical protein L1887_61837 [Cichorium endivia]
MPPHQRVERSAQPCRQARGAVRLCRAGPAPLVFEKVLPRPAPVLVSACCSRAAASNSKIRAKSKSVVWGIEGAGANMHAGGAAVKAYPPLTTRCGSLDSRDKKHTDTMP